MSKKESNKGIYIFWGAIILALTAVLLFVFLPRTNMTAMYNNVLAAQYQTNAQDKNHRSISNFVESFLSDPSSNSATTTNLNNLYTLQKALTLGNKLCLNGLMFVTPGNGFKAHCAEQARFASSFLGTIQNFRTYCTNYITPFFDGHTTYADRAASLNESLTVFFNKYKELIKQMSAFYYATAKIMYTSSNLCMEVNMNMLDNHLELTNHINELAILEVFSTAEANQVMTTATTIYADDYYKNFI